MEQQLSEQAQQIHILKRRTVVLYHALEGILCASQLANNTVEDALVGDKLDEFIENAVTYLERMESSMALIPDKPESIEELQSVPVTRARVERGTVSVGQLIQAALGHRGTAQGTSTSGTTSPQSIPRREFEAPSLSDMVEDESIVDWLSSEGGEIEPEDEPDESANYTPPRRGRRR